MKLFAMEIKIKSNFKKPKKHQKNSYFTVIRTKMANLKTGARYAKSWKFDKSIQSLKDVKRIKENLFLKSKET